MSTATLTSLAILRVTVDHKGDYLNYLRPFILQVLCDHKPSKFSGSDISKYIRDQFGLAIPERTIEIVLKRIARQYSIKKDRGKYRMSGELPDPGLRQRQAAAERHIAAVLWGLQRFSEETINPIDNDEDAVSAICAFLSEFDVTCLRAYLRGTAIPNLDGRHSTGVVLVSDYVRHMQRTDPGRFDSFLILVQGHMLANALLCPDLQNAPATYRNVTFYLDTPLLVRRLGLEDKPKEEAISVLIDLLIRLGGRVAAFSHSCDELQLVVRGAADNLDTHRGRGAIVFEARKRGTTRADLLLFADSIEEKLRHIGINVETTPPYKKDFQIDEELFEQMLEREEPHRHNPQGKRFDINSVRSIYVLRGGRLVRSVEKARAVFVTSNAAFARAAWKYDRHFEPSQNVSSVMPDFSLANTAWLKAPMGANQIPTTQLLAFSYAALEPSDEYLNKFMAEIDRLEQSGEISARDHQLLRSSVNAIPEVMHITLGMDAALTRETITRTLERVTSDITKEATEELLSEQESHQKTRDELDIQKAQITEIKSNVYWKSRKRASNWAWACSIVLAILLLICLIVGLGLLPRAMVPTWILIGSPVMLAVATLANLLVGATVRRIHERIQGKFLACFIELEEKTLGVALHEIDINELNAGTESRRVEG